MKTVVSTQDLLEFEIKPDDLLQRFRELSREAVAERWGNGDGLVDVACPGCNSLAREQAFERCRLQYQLCSDCGSLYVSPRPSQPSLDEYFLASLPARFWREQVLPATETARREKLVVPRAQWVADGIAEHGSPNARIVDVSSHGRPLVEAMRAEIPDVREVSVAASIDAAAGPLDVVTAFDLLDRIANVAAFVSEARRVLRPGGLLFITAPAISGFELQVLWDRSGYIAPPEKLNLLSADGFMRRFQAPAWEVIEFSTPGVLDVDNVRRAVEASPEHDWPRFVRQLVAQRPEALVAFQEYLQQYRLASFARLLVRKVG